MRRRRIGWLYGFTAVVVTATVGVAGCSAKSKDRNEANLPTTLGLPQPINYDAVYVVNGTGNTITVINAETDFVNPSKIALRNTAFPHSITLSKDRSKLLVAAGAASSPSEADGGTDGGNGGSNPEDAGHETDAGHDAGHDGGRTLAALAPLAETVDVQDNPPAGEGAAGAVLVLNATTGSTIKGRFTGPLQNAVFGADENEVWAAESTTPGNVLVMLTSTLVTKATVKVGDAPARISIAENGRYALVANTASNSVSAIDTAGKLVPKNGTVKVGNGPIGAWQGPDDLAYVDNAGDGTVSVIDTRSLSVLRSFKLGFTAGAVASDAAKNIWITDPKAGKVAIFSPTGVRTWEISTGAGAYGIAFSEDKKTAYVANTGADTVSIITVSGKIVRRNLNVGGNPNWVLFRPKDKGGFPGSGGGDAGK